MAYRKRQIVSQRIDQKPAEWQNSILYLESAFLGKARITRTPGDAMRPSGIFNAAAYPAVDTIDRQWLIANHEKP